MGLSTQSIMWKDVMITFWQVSSFKVPCKGDLSVDAELIFGATGATGGRVKFLSAV